MIRKILIIGAMSIVSALAGQEAQILETIEVAENRDQFSISESTLNIEIYEPLLVVEDIIPVKPLTGAEEVLYRSFLFQQVVVSRSVFIPP